MVTTAEPTADDRRIEELARAAATPDESQMTEAGLMTVEHAGWVWTYNTKTGDPSRVNRNMLLSQLKKTHGDGTRAFTLEDPGFRPPRGQVKCMLHPDIRPAEYDTYGFPTCNAGHLRNLYQMRRHMRSRHRDVFEALEMQREEERREEDRQFQREVLGKAAVGPPAAEAGPADLVPLFKGAAAAMSEPVAVEYNPEQEPELRPRPASDEVYGEVLKDGIPPPPDYNCKVPGCGYKPKKRAKRPGQALGIHMRSHSAQEVQALRPQGQGQEPG